MCARTARRAGATFDAPPVRWLIPRIEDGGCTIQVDQSLIRSLRSEAVASVSAQPYPNVAIAK